MQQKKFIISFVGLACSGKSTLAKLLADKVSDIYLVSTDKQKWLLSGYDRNTHPVPIKEITFGLFEAVCKTGFPIQLEYIRSEEDYKKCKELADQYGYSFFCIELEAPRQILIERFHERVANAKANGTQLSFTTDDVFISNLDKGYYAPPGSVRFDTTKVTTGEIISEVLSMLVTSLKSESLIK